MLKSLTVLASAVFFFSTLAACGGGGSSGSNDPPPPAVDTGLDWDQGNWDEVDWQ